MLCFAVHIAWIDQIVIVSIPGDYQQIYLNVHSWQLSQGLAQIGRIGSEMTSGDSY